MKHLTCAKYSTVFSQNGIGGNKACVLLDKEYSRVEKQAVAKEVGFSETVFIKKTDNIYFLEFFTPEDEVELCGHGTIAAVDYIMDIFDDKPKFVMTKSGEIEIQYNDNIIYIKLGNAEEIKTLFDIKMLSEVTNLGNNIIKFGKLLPKIFKSGIADIIMPVKDYNSLMEIEIDREKLINLSKIENVIGLHCFTIENNQIYARNFAPLYGIDEESATGTSNNSVVDYLAREKLLPSNSGIIIQGRDDDIGNVHYLYKDTCVYIGGEVTKFDLT
ncbi:MAG: PhzF family phenazine biosynthesis protein [Clostridiales bacterium]|nr:PhzF family phenazine biosynthesis protein [Clostridiales bacterium]